ncbi:MAG: large conductance mechanosensitive channel protein MscL [Chitinophagales bacterium]|jgi:large conductance mechanosensitive channel|nr:large conductance mechanosensitive channel protein MscL [Chitinophagales bacterium]
MFKEFKEFALRGNVIDLAIATIIGGTFNSIVTAIIDNLFMPFIGMLWGAESLEKMIYVFQGTEFKYGLIIAAFIKFILVALFLFLVVKAINASKKEEAAPEAAPEISSTDALLKDILEELRKR